MKSIERSFFFKIILPTLLAILLFIATIFLLILPRLEQAIMDSKREMIAQLTNSTISILDSYNQKITDSILTTEQAQEQAIKIIEKIRYGLQNKDYFWITDEYPHMIMHPYRNDLNSKDLSNYQDKSGKKPFVEFVQIVKESQQGYLEYLWQWKDDSLHVVPKLSFVKEYKNWKWIIGTGVYLDDVNQEMKKMTSSLIKISIAIALILAFLLFFIMQQSLKTERNRITAELNLKKSEEKYKLLVESATEGILMLIDNKIAYFNATFQSLTNYSITQIEHIEIETLLPNWNNIFYNHQNNLPNNETKLKLANGELLDIKIALQESKTYNNKTLIITIKDNSEKVSIEKQLESNKEKYMTLFRGVDIGIFRTTFDFKGVLLEANNFVLKLLAIDELNDNNRINVFELINSKEDRQNIIAILQKNKFVKNATIQFVNKKNVVITAVISIAVVKDKLANMLVCEGVIEDITDKMKLDILKDNYISELQNTNLFYLQPVKNIVKQIVTADYQADIKNISQIFMKTETETVLLNVQNKDNIGTIELKDIVTRVNAQNKDNDTKAFEIMTAPINQINENKSVAEVLNIMQHKNINAFVTTNNINQISGIVYIKDMINLHNYLIYNILDQINKTDEPNKLKQIFNNIPYIVRPLIDSQTDIQLISNIISQISDAIGHKIIDIALSELGEAPVKFAFFVLGSEGRKEQSLAFDQDNAIIYEDTNENNQQDIENYFYKLGELICNYLNHVGFEFCKGNIMAKNPKWNKNITTWKKYFTKWILEPNPEHLLEVAIFFDFKFIYGDNDLFTQFADYVNNIATQNTIFYFHLAQNANLYKAPLNIRGNITTENIDNSLETFNIKNAITPLVMFARIYSLKHKLNLANTLERLQTLQEMQIFDNNYYREIAFNYRYLMGIRYKNQLAQVLDKRAPNNHVPLNNLLQIEQSILKKIFTQVAIYQQKLNLDFKGNYM